MGYFEKMKARRRAAIIKEAIAQGLVVPSRQQVRTQKLLHWIRGDYTLKNSELLFSAVSRISNALAAMPVQLYRGATPVDDELNDLVSFEPNPNMTSCQFFKTMEACRCTAGNCYAMKIYDQRGALVRIDILDPTRVQPVMEQERGELWFRLNPEGGKEFYVHNYYMKKSKKFDTVRGYYDSGLWALYRVRAAVVKGWITAEEYQKITGEAYEQSPND